MSKKLKVLTTILITLTLIVGITYNAFGSSDSRKQLNIKDSDNSKNIYLWDMEDTYNNVYCIEKDQAMSMKNPNYSIRTKIVIEGNEAKFYTKKKGGSYEISKTVINEANNILAGILTNGKDDDKKSQVFRGDEYTYGYKVNGKYTDAQIALYKYIGVWNSTVNAGLSLGKSNLSSSESSKATKIINQVKSKVNEYKYKVTMYVLKHGIGYYQTLLAVEPEPVIKDEPINIPVEKKWLDEDNKYKTRPDYITVKLFANGEDTNKTVKLNKDNGWKSSFNELDQKDKNGNVINYTIKEVEVNGYFGSIKGNKTDGFIITNIAKTEITVMKEWDDQDNLDEIRPTSIKVELFSNGNKTGKTLTLDENNGWKDKFLELKKYDSKGEEIKYTLKENSVEGYTDKYTKSVDEKGNVIYKIVNTHVVNYEGYIEIKGKVWEDIAGGKGNAINGVIDDDENGIEGIKVVLRDEYNNIFDANSEEVYTDKNGNYTIKVNYDNSQKAYKLYEDSAKVIEKLNKSYIEFEYDAMKYTTVKVGESKAIENEKIRNTFDSAHSIVNNSTQYPDEWENKTITAATNNVISFETYSDKKTESREEIIKYCNGNGTYIRTNSNNAWDDLIKGEHSCTNCNNEGHVVKKYKVDVQVIQNVNLGLFKREQPEIGINIDLTKVEVEMKGQKYTYLYGVESAKYEGAEIKAKFQNKNTYTYKRPVNPADIACLQEEGNENAMSVIVTYNASIYNFSTTLPITVHGISNYFDNQYTMTTDGWTIIEGTEFNKAVNNNLNIRVEPGKESEFIELKYVVSIDAIRNLLNEQATLNNAVEIEVYSSEYGEKTLYAEQRTDGIDKQNGLNGRAKTAYAGYDNKSHPGNAGIFINNEERLQATNLEQDTDIAPAFCLVPDNDVKILSGTIWEDSNIMNNGERLGNGVYDGNEKLVQNVKVELYEIVRDNDGNITSVELAKLYDNKGNVVGDAVTYTDVNGYYSFAGLRTSEYYAKVTYGNNKDELGYEATTIDGGNTTINARNYKSTIITNSKIKDILEKDYVAFSDNEKKWHITHDDGYSIAVDNMADRLAIPDLQYSNYYDAVNMSAYTKPFALQVEFEVTGESKVEVTDQENDNHIIEGNINVSNELTKLDFGIIERPREDLFVESTVTGFKLELANGTTIVDGNPIEKRLEYAKEIELKKEFSNGAEARNSVGRRLLVEVDDELIQGSRIEIIYRTKIKNNNELDYDYGNSTDYNDILNSANNSVLLTEKYDKFITKSDKANYYYYGNSTALAKMTATIMYVDYLSNEIGKVDSDVDKWISLDANQLKVDGLINEQNDVSGYALLRKQNNETLTLGRGESIEAFMLTKKEGLAKTDNRRFDNSLEIIRIDSKTARTIQEVREGKQIAKTYIPGNYIPGKDVNEYGDNINQQDDDIADVIITGPTGTNYVAIYVIVATIGLTVISAGIMFIKKKVLIK